MGFWFRRLLQPYPSQKILFFTLFSCYLCSFCLAARGHRHPAELPDTRSAVVEPDEHQYTIPLIGAQPSTAPMRPGQRLRVNNLPAHNTLPHIIPLVGAIPRSRRRTQGDDYFKTEKI